MNDFKFFINPKPILPKESIDEVIVMLLNHKEVFLKLGIVTYMSANMFGSSRISEKKYFTELEQCERSLINNIKKVYQQNFQSQLDDLIDADKISIYHDDNAAEFLKIITHSKISYNTMFKEKKSPTRYLFDYKAMGFSLEGKTVFLENESSMNNGPRIVFYPKGVEVRFQTDPNNTHLYQFFAFKLDENLSFQPCFHDDLTSELKV